jgi:hypothetical protein
MRRPGRRGTWRFFQLACFEGFTWWREIVIALRLKLRPGSGLAPLVLVNTHLKSAI